MELSAPARHDSTPAIQNDSLSLLPERHIGRLLEIGYGSGVFLPELAKRCDELYGIDPHRAAASVARNLAAHRVHAGLFSGSAVALPFQEASIDCLVAVSCLEYVEPFDHAVAEFKRVLKPGGSLVFVTPSNSPLLDAAHYLLTGCRAQGSASSDPSSAVYGAAEDSSPEDVERCDDVVSRDANGSALSPQVLRSPHDATTSHG